MVEVRQLRRELWVDFRRFVIYVCNRQRRRGLDAARQRHSIQQRRGNDSNVGRDRHDYASTEHIADVDSDTHLLRLA